MSNYHSIAVDLGAESGRVMDVQFDGHRFEQTEVHRFPNNPVCVHDTLHWDILRLWHEIQDGIARVESDVDSLGIATWGVDYALLDGQGNLLANPVHYRDSRTEGMMEWVYERMSRTEIFHRTGSQHMSINTIYHLASMAQADSDILKAARLYLSIPDLLHYWLCGVARNEFTHATTTQCYNPHTQDWDREMLETLGIPGHIFGEIIPPGTQLGEYNGMPVIVPATHDTASAVVAVPTTTENYAYLSSGTWSLLGLELPHPIITDAACEANVTNEGGVYGTYRFLKNVVGLWLAQQCRATWRAEGTNYSYDDLTAAAAEAEPFRSLVDPDHPDFLAPGDMPERIRAYCRRTGQPEPESVGQVMRAVYESLALKYRYVLDRLVALADKPVDRLHIIGGGGRNHLLCQMAANAINREVVVGPYEATALGNAVMQLITLGALDNVAQARGILAATVDTVAFAPQQTDAWESAYQRFEMYVEDSSS